MKQKPSILLDVDGVLADFVGAICRELKAKFNVTYTPEEFKLWDLKYTLGPCYSAAEEIVETPGFCLWGIREYAGAFAFVEQLKSFGIIRPITSPWLGSVFWYAERVKWLEDFRLKTPMFVPTEAKYLVTGDILIEDNLDTCNQWAGQRRREGLQSVAMLLDRPWNQGALGPGVTRMSGYNAILDSLDKVFGGI